MYQKVVAWGEKSSFENETLGGLGVEVETDIIILGHEQKGGLGFFSLNKCYLQYVGEREGRILLELFANPRGGSERMTQIKPLLDNIESGSILLSDGSRGVKCWVLDNPAKNILHLAVNHCKSSTDGFTWYVYLDADDGHGFESLTNGEYRCVEVSTQKADGFGGIFKMWLNQKRGFTRSDVKGYIKEFQFRSNNAGKDIFHEFLTIWGELETILREDPSLMSDVNDGITWDFSSYVHYDIDNFKPSWTCPGCEFTVSGNEWKNERKKHKRGCTYYKNISSRSYVHENSRCLCCTYPYHDSTPKGRKRKATLPPLKKNRGKFKKKKLFTCPYCCRTISDTASSRWQHRQKNADCNELYLKNKQK